jgi:hypothetical protein
MLTPTTTRLVILVVKIWHYDIPPFIVFNPGDIVAIVKNGLLLPDDVTDPFLPLSSRALSLAISARSSNSN